MKTSLFFLFVYFVVNTYSQTPPNVVPLIEVELAFSNMAKEKNTRDAFLHFLADSSVMFKGGKAVSGIKLYESRKPDSTLLWWSPDYSSIASSGDFGFNTGHWHFYRTRKDTTPTAIGHFATIWIKQYNGEWRAALDIGISYPKPDKEYPLRLSKKHTGPNRTVNTLNEASDLIEIENKFINSRKINTFEVYAGNLSTEARVFIDGYQPFLTKNEINDYIKNISNNVKDFLPINALIAPSGDMGCVYGSATIIAKEAEASNQKPASYIHVWKLEEDGWKLVLEVVSE